MSRAVVVLFLSGLCTIHVPVRSMVICKESKVAFFHAPKCGGSSVSKLLEQNSDDCLRLGWGIITAYKDRSTGQDVSFDSAHVTPKELEEFLFWNIGRLKQWWNREDHLRAWTVLDTNSDWQKNVTVRNPYLRVLSAFDQRRGNFHDRAWGSDYPRENVESFMPCFCVRAGCVVERKQYPRSLWRRYQRVDQ